MKKPKAKWQIATRAKLDEMGIGYRELAERIGETEALVNQAMCKDNMPRIRNKICENLKIVVE